MSVLGSVTLPRRGVSGGVSVMGVSGPRGMSGVSESPCRSTASDGDRPELELDMWEGQFNLSNDDVHGLTMDMVEDLMPLMFNNDINIAATKWERESEVTCTTVQNMCSPSTEVPSMELPSLTDNRYIQLKKENMDLHNRINKLETSFKDRGRFQKDGKNRSEVVYLRKQVDILKAEMAVSEQQLVEEHQLVISTQEAHRALQETYRRVQDEWNEELQGNKLVIEELTNQLETLRNEKEGKQIKTDENRERLKAEMLNKGFDEGIRVIRETGNTALATELEEMSVKQMRKCIQDQQEVNKQLRNYIDNVLLNIMEKYPNLLEIIPKK